MLTPAIESFDGHYRFLSNFFLCDVNIEGITYPSSEHAYQAAKATNDKDHNYILDAPTPYESKVRAREVPNVEDWHQIKVSVMAGVLYMKFTQHLDLRQKLLDTGDVDLIEGNHWGDTFWGVCRGKGTNVLGGLLMILRDELRKEDERLHKAG